jgi:lysophospholipase L1-like esterase
MRSLIFATLALGITGTVSVQPAHAYSVPLPRSMASTGDSITRAYDINWFHLLSDSPQYSWSTGYSSSVSSQYERILALNPKISGHEFNDAKTGAKMADLDGQVKTAASQGVRYLTVLMGANDLCTSSAATMTSTATFTAQFGQALGDFFAADPTAHVYVSSLPNIYQLWSVLHTNSAARSTWSTFGICQSMLNNSNTDTQRQLVVAQEAADNQALLNTCAKYSNCRWDNYAGFNFSFPAGDISTVDYFHPNIQGQNDVARVTWGASYWGT